MLIEKCYVQYTDMNTYTGYTLITASKDFFKRYADFSGRSTLSAYWYWYLTNFLICWALAIIEKGFFDTPFDSTGMMSGLWSFVTLIPSLALWVRRLHDIGKSGWTILWMAIPGVITAAFACVWIYMSMINTAAPTEGGEETVSVIVLIGLMIGALMVLIGGIILFIYSLKDSQKGTNKWGASEKYPDEVEETP